MPDEPTRPRAADELEDLWSGEFGDAYVGRNAPTMDVRGPFWARILDQYPSRRVLEVGCANGANLHQMAKLLPAQNLWGADINLQALEGMRATVPGVNGAYAVARELPFRDRYFDLVFTVGLLIHQPDSTLPVVMSEIVRCSNRWIMCGEYQADETTDVNYHGMSGVLTKRDYGRLYQDLFPDLELREQMFLTKEEGFDRVTFDVFERKR
jgi:pseudaminic acid biosynthesis-associated methylase